MYAPFILSSDSTSLSHITQTMQVSEFQEKLQATPKVQQHHLCCLLRYGQRSSIYTKLSVDSERPRSVKCQGAIIVA